MRYPFNTQVTVDLSLYHRSAKMIGIIVAEVADVGILTDMALDPDDIAPPSCSLLLVFHAEGHPAHTRFKFHYSSHETYPKNPHSFQEFAIHGTSHLPSWSPKTCLLSNLKSKHLILSPSPLSRSLSFLVDALS